MSKQILLWSLLIGAGLGVIAGALLGELAMAVAIGAGIGLVIGTIIIGHDRGSI